MQKEATSPPLSSAYLVIGFSITTL